MNKAPVMSALQHLWPGAALTAGRAGPAAP